MLIIGLFCSEASLLSVNYFTNYMNIQKDEDEKSTRHSSKGIPERRVKEIYSLCLKERQPVKVLRSLNDRQCDIALQILGNGKNPSNSNYHFVD